MRVLFESEFLRPMPKHRYFLEASNSNMYNHKERHFWPLEKSKCSALRREQAWHCSKKIKSPAFLGQKVLKGKVWEIKLRSRQA